MHLKHIQMQYNKRPKISHYTKSQLHKQNLVHNFTRDILISNNFVIVSNQISFHVIQCLPGHLENNKKATLRAAFCSWSGWSSENWATIWALIALVCKFVSLWILPTLISFYHRTVTIQFQYITFILLILSWSICSCFWLQKNI